MPKSKLQQKRSHETRRAIMEAAETLWQNGNFDAISVDDICKAADVAKGTFYFYFPRKEYLLVMHVFSRFLPRMTEIQAEMNSNGTTAQVLTRLCESISRRVRKLPKDLVLRAVEESFQHYRGLSQVEGGNINLRTYFTMIFTRAAARKEIVADWDIDILAGMMGWNVLQEIFMWGSGQIPLSNLGPNMLERADLVIVGAAQPRRASMASSVRNGGDKSLLIGRPRQTNRPSRAG